MEDSYLMQVIKELNIKTWRLKNDELHCLCLNPEHDDQHLGNFSINLRTGKFNCFSCGFHGNIIQLLNSFGTTYARAIAIWNGVRKTDILRLPPVPVDKFIINAYKKNGVSTYAENRVGDEKILSEYNVFSDENGNPVFLTQDSRKRYTSVWVRENGAYYLIEPLTAKKDGVFLGEHLPPTEFTVLTEGPFDAMAVRKYTGLRGICGFGTYLSVAQINKLLRMGNLIIMMDGDAAGRKAREKIINTIYDSPKSKNLALPSVFVAGGYKDDPDELGDEIRKIFLNLKNILDFNLMKWKEK